MDPATSFVVHIPLARDQSETAVIHHYSGNFQRPEARGVGDSEFGKTTLTLALFVVVPHPFVFGFERVVLLFSCSGR